jgi:hypothetical protein
MSKVDDRARREHEEGRNGAKTPFLERNIRDIVNDHSDSSAYWKGREGRDLDDNKKD